MAKSVAIKLTSNEVKNKNANNEVILNCNPIPYYSEYITREKELKEINEKLTKHNFVILSSDISGIGKGILSKNYAKRYENRYKYEHFVSNCKSVEEFICGLSFKGYENYDSLSFKMQFELKSKLFSKLDSSTFIIIADFDEDYALDQNFANVIGTCKCKVLITSTRSSDIYPCVKLEKMSDDDLLELFRHYCKSVNYDDNTLINFFKAIDSHTMTITLVASLIETTDMSLKEIEKNMFNIDDSVFLEKNHSKDSINNHLINLFNLSSTYLSPSEIEILSLLTLIAPSGIGRMELTKCTNTKPQVIEELSKKGYVNLTKERPVFVSLNRLMSQIIYHNFKPDLQTYDKAIFLINDLIKFDKTKFIPVSKKQEFCKYGEYLKEREMHPTLNTIDLLINLSYYYGTCANLQWALELCKRALSFQKKLKSEEKLILCNYQISYIYEGLGEFDEGLEALKKILPLAKKRNDTEMTAKIYNQMGSLYRKKGLYQKSLEVHEKALTLWLKIEKQNSCSIEAKRNVAICHNDIGSTLERLNRQEEALVEKLKGLEIRRKILDKNHQDIAKSLNNVGNSYNRLNKPKEALKYELDALEIRKNILPKFHPNIAKTYNNIGFSYTLLKEYDNAIKSYENALDINFSLYGYDHINTSYTLYHTAILYLQINQYSKAIELLIKSLIAREKLKVHIEYAEALELLAKAYKLNGEEKNFNETLGECINIYKKLKRKDKIMELKILYEQ